MRRFFLDNQLPVDGLLTIVGQEMHHLKNVLRLKVGTRVIFFDGNGWEYEAELENMGNHEISARIISTRQEVAERCRVSLAQGLLTGQKMDLVVQKATELGIGTIVPFISRYCAAREASANKVQRWQRIAREACKQCRRTREPVILPVTTWLECLDLANDHDLTVVFWEKASAHNLGDLRDLISSQPTDSLLFLIGPEGGLTSEEIAQAQEKNAHIIGLGKRILRAETATITAAALIQYLVGNLD